MITNGQPTGLASDFINYLLSPMARRLSLPKDMLP